MSRNTQSQRCTTKSQSGQTFPDCSKNASLRAGHRTHSIHESACGSFSLIRGLMADPVGAMFVLCSELDCFIIWTDYLSEKKQKKTKEKFQKQTTRSHSRELVLEKDSHKWISYPSWTPNSVYFLQIFLSAIQPRSPEHKIKATFRSPLVSKWGHLQASCVSFQLAVPWGVRGYQPSLGPAHLRDRVKKKAFFSLPLQFYGPFSPGKDLPREGMAASFFLGQVACRKSTSSPLCTPARSSSTTLCGHLIPSLKGGQTDKKKNNGENNEKW